MGSRNRRNRNPASSGFCNSTRERRHARIGYGSLRATSLREGGSCVRRGPWRVASHQRRDQPARVSCDYRIPPQLRNRGYASSRASELLKSNQFLRRLPQVSRRFGRSACNFLTCPYRRGNTSLLYSSDPAVEKIFRIPGPKRIV